MSDLARRIAPEAFSVLENLSKASLPAYSVLSRGVTLSSQELSLEELEFLSACIHRTHSNFEAKQCFHNSQYLLLSNVPHLASNPSMELQYYEGYVLSDQLYLPIHHGWLVLNRKVVDLTLTQEEFDTRIEDLEDRIIGEIPSDMVYIGIPISTEDVLERIQTSGGTHTILEDWDRRFSHIKNKYLVSLRDFRMSQSKR